MIIKDLTYYLQGKLTHDEEMKLWNHLLQHPKELALLKTYWILLGKPDHNREGLMF
jgi:hypothetical protein